MEVTQTVGDIVNKIIFHLEEQEKGGHPDTALLAAFRNASGKPLSEAQDVWPLLFEYMPAAFLSVSGKPTYQENALFITLQMYSIAKQGSTGKVKSDSSFRGNMGRSLSAARNDDTRKGMDRRFNAMTAAGDFSEFAYYLRQLFKLAKNKAEITINYGKLADDLYRYQAGQNARICFHWAEGYYGNYTEKQ